MSTSLSATALNSRDWEQLSVLATVGDETTRELVARNPASSRETLAVLAHDDKESVVVEAAKNPHQHPLILTGLAARESGSSRFVLESVASNPTTPQPVLDELANSYYAGVQAAVARNWSASEESVRFLSDSYAEEVASNPSAPAQVLRRVALRSDGCRAEAARNPSCPPQLLREYAKDPVHGVRVAVADNPSTPSVVLETLSHDLSEEVRYCVAYNPSTPNHVVIRMAETDVVGVKESIALRYTSPPEVRAVIFPNHDFDDIED